MGVCVILVGASMAVVMSERIPDIGHLTRDPTAVAEVPWWTGVLSRLTNLCWAVAATVNLVAARASVPSRRQPLLLLGVLSAAFAIDDAMLVHETVMPNLGVPEEFVLATYALAGLVLVRSWSGSWSWWRTQVGAAFFTGAAMLAVSVAADAFGATALLLLEDGAKLIGVLAWCFCGVWAYSDLSLERPPNAPAGRN